MSEECYLMKQSLRESLVVGAVEGVCGCEDAAPRVERAMDACLCNCDSLLLHHLVNGHTVLVAHLIKLVNANKAPAEISKMKRVRHSVVCDIIEGR